LKTAKTKRSRGNGKSPTQPIVKDGKYEKTLSQDQSKLEEKTFCMKPFGGLGKNLEFKPNADEE